jgi:phosphoribosylpyrophosphate synthetase
LPIEEVLVTNTLPQIRYKKIHIVDIAPLVLKALGRT